MQPPPAVGPGQPTLSPGVQPVGQPMPASGQAFGQPGMAGAPGWAQPGAVPGYAMPMAGHYVGHHPMMMQPADTTMASLAHVGGFFTWIIPLVVYLVKKDQDPFVRDHSAQSLNMVITFFVSVMVHVALMFVLIGFLTFLIHWVLYLVWMIQGAMAATRGKLYRYPMCFQIIT